MTESTAPSLIEQLRGKRDRVHPTNRRPDLPIMLKMTFGDLEQIISLATNQARIAEMEGALSILRGGHWTASVFHNPPVRGKVSNTNFLKASSIRIDGEFASADLALAAAEAAIEIGRPSIGTFIHQPSAVPLVHYNLSADQIDQLGILAARTALKSPPDGGGE